MRELGERMSAVVRDAGAVADDRLPKARQSREVEQAQPSDLWRSLQVSGGARVTDVPQR